MPPELTMQHKTFEVKVAERRKDGGKIIINTAGLDRQRDRVLPTGVDANAYLKNPIVQWGHNYREPWSTIGKTTAIDVTDKAITVDFELRPAANDQDPQNVVKLLWEGGWVKTASIGFLPTEGKPNDQGGMDFTKWELLEWSLVPIPANAEALRLAMKALDKDEGGRMNDEDPDSADSPDQESAQAAEPSAEIVIKRGRVLSAKNEGKIRAAREHLDAVLSDVAQQTEDDDAAKYAEPSKDVDITPEFDFHAPDVKGAIPSHETPTAPPDTAWDGPAVVASLPNDRAKLRLVHAWVDSEGDPDAKQSYKLPHHLADGRVVLRGVNNAKARLPQSSIPMADHSGVMSHLERHQNQFEKAAVLRDTARALTEVAEELDGDRHLSEEDERDLIASLQEMIDVFKENLK
jgi:hypothetical protein